MTTLRIVLADDEPLARTALRRTLQRLPNVAIVGEARHGDETVTMVRETRPDVLLLDVRMPGCTGVEVLAALGADVPDAVIFVTAYDGYAVEAFERHAVDYVVKPFDDARLGLAISRARQRLGGVPTQDRAADRLELLLAACAAPGPRLERFLVRVGERTHVVVAKDVEWLEAADNYVRLHVRDTTYLIRDTMRALEQQLDPRLFARVHRSAMVNLTRVVEVTGSMSSEMHLRLDTGASLPVAQAWREGLLRRLRGGSDGGDVEHHR